MSDADSFLIAAHAGSGAFTRARNILRERIAQGYAPRAIRVYNTLIRVLCTRGSMSEAEEILAWAYENSTPTAASYFPIIACMYSYYIYFLILFIIELYFIYIFYLPCSFYKPDARKKHDAGSAMRLYAKMREHNVQPDMYIFCELLNMFSYDDPRTARIFADMESLGVPPTIVTHNIVIASEGRAGQVDAVRRRIALMHEQEIFPNAMTYLALVHAYKARKDPHGAASVLNEMRQAGIPPHTEYVL